MLPVYFLSILFNALAGYLFVFGEDRESVFSLSLNETIRLVIGGISFLTGILKILSPVAGNVPVVGDLVPALANLAAGFIFIFEFYRSRSTIDSAAAGRIAEVVEKNKRLTGFVCFAAALLHFIFYPVLFL